MQSPPLHLVSHTHYYCGGNVNIAPTAAIASGVVLQALPGASIDIGAGVCLGAGVVIQAKLGCVTVEREASLGTSVLIVGHGVIGQGACIGPASTLINPDVEPHGIIPPNSLSGDQGRSVDQQGDHQGTGSVHHAKASSNDPAHRASNGLGGNRSSGTRGVSGAGFQSFSKATYQESTYQKSTYREVSYQTSPTSSGSDFSPGPSTVPISPRTTTPIEPKPVDIPDIGYSVSGFTAGTANNLNNNGDDDNVGAGTMSDSGHSSLAVNRSGYVYGRDQVNGLLSALFPHRQNLNEP